MDWVFALRSGFFQLSILVCEIPGHERCSVGEFLDFGCRPRISGVRIVARVWKVRRIQRQNSRADSWGHWLVRRRVILLPDFLWFQAIAEVSGSSKGRAE